MAWKDRIGGRTGKRALEGVNFAVYTAVVIAIIVFVNVFVNRNYDRRWDLTPNKKFTLSPQTVKLLKGLDHDITIYDFDRQGGSQTARDLLNNYGSETRHLTVRYLDPVRDPALARELEVRSEGTVIVASGSRHFQAQSVDEEGVTNALIRVLKGEKSVYFLQGHGERNLDGSEGSDFSEIKSALGNENYQVKTLVLLEKNEIPTDASVVVLAGPQKDYLPPEIDTLRSFLAKGGRALFMLDPGHELPNLAKLLEGWNVTPRNDLVVDMNPVARLFGTTPTMPLIIKYGENPIVDPLKRTATLFPLTRSFDIGKAGALGVTDDSLCETTDASFGVADFNPKMQSVSYREGKDYKGPLTVAVAGSLSAPGPAEPGQPKKPEGRFVVTGTSLVAANSYLSFQGNRDLVMNMVNWLSAEEDLISIRPKPPENQHLDLNEQQMRRIFYLGVLGIPLLIIAAGFSVWWGRR
ncbi:MAG TPA: GldG family protein [Terriglobia bacterium]|nr:GldG family protein [Terriglobia bacterium]